MARFFVRGNKTIMKWCRDIGLDPEKIHTLIIHSNWISDDDGATVHLETKVPTLSGSMESEYYILRDADGLKLGRGHRELLHWLRHLGLDPYKVKGFLISLSAEDKIASLSVEQYLEDEAFDNTEYGFSVEKVER